MQYWINLWTVVLAGGIFVFALLAIVVSYGGAFDIYKLLKSISSKRDLSEKPHSDGMQ